MQTMIDATDANNMQFAIMLTLKNYSNLAKIQRELDRIIGLGEALEVDIDTACSGYTA
jgi:acyl-CoA hydrolase